MLSSLFFSCLLLSQAWSFANIKEKSIHYSTSFFGDISFGTVNPRITFDQDLFVGEDFFCSSNFVPSIPECIPCNYSGLSGAGQKTFFLLSQNLSFYSNFFFLLLKTFFFFLKDGKCLEPELNTRDVPTLTEEQKNTLPNCPCEPTFCDGELLSIGEKPKKVVITKSEARKIFKFENIHWDRGFVVHVVPESEGQSDYFISTSNLLEASKVSFLALFLSKLFRFFQFLKDFFF